MKNSFSIAVWMTLASILVKLALFALDVDIQKNITYMAFCNLLVISVGTFFGVRTYKIQHPGPQLFRDEVKAGMRTAAFYALLMAAFVYVYYSFIDTTSFAALIQSRVDAAQAAIDQGQEIDLENVRQFVEFIFSPRTHSTITLFGFLLAGTIYSLLITYFMRRFPGYK